MNLYAASGVGAEGQTASDYLLVGAPGEQNQNVITIHPISGDVVDDAIGTRVGWLSEFFVNGEALWLSVWTGSASAFSAFVPSSGEFSALSGDDYFEARDIALDVSSVVRTEDSVIELRALGLGIPDDAEIWTDMDWAIETLADGGLLVRAEIYPADAALGDVTSQTQRLQALALAMQAEEATILAYLEQFSIGRRSLADLLDAQRDLFSAAVGLVDGAAGVELAHYAVAAALGESLPASTNCTVLKKPLLKISSWLVMS